MSVYLEVLCRMKGTVESYPDCTDPATLNMFDSSSVSTAMYLCEYYKQTLIVTKVYFSLALVNIVYVIISSVLLICRTMAIQHNKKSLLFPISEIQRNALKKRNIVAVAVGAMGHLIIISIFILTQAMNGCLSCPIFMYFSCYGYVLWIASFMWRVYYLRFQLKLHKIKLRLGNGETKEDRDWYMHNKDQHSVSDRRFLSVLLFGLTIITVPLILTHRFYFGFQPAGVEDCATRIGTIVLLCLVTFFSCIISPILIWLIRHDRDAHNLRNELIVIFAIAFPTSILYVVWVTALPSSFQPLATSFQPNASRVRLYWGSINWIAIQQMAAHFISITYPLLESYGLCSCKCMRQPDKMKSRHNSIKPAFALDCSMTSLEYIISQPELLEHMKDIAVQDFSAENVLFCEHYQILADKVLSKSNEKSTTAGKVEGMHIHGLPDCSIPISLQADYVAFYNTFVKEGSPLQVNIAHSDRKAMDEVFREYASRQLQILEHAVSQVKSVTHSTWSTSDYVPNVNEVGTKDESNSISEEYLIDHELDTDTIIPCSVFDNARKEVMWIIFCNILPKFLDNCK